MSGQGFEAANYIDEAGMPAGGFVVGQGISINWQNGPLVDPQTGARLSPSGAFVEDVIAAAKQRIEWYNSDECAGGRFRCRENSLAITKLEEALHWLEARTADREKRGVEGTHQQ